MKVGSFFKEPWFIHTISSEILADSKNSDEICYEVAHKAEQLYNFFISKYLEI